MNFAVIKFAGKQYLVKENDQIVVAGSRQKIDRFDLTDILLLNLNDSLQIGDPLVKNTRIQAQVVTSGKGEKIRVAKFKAKSRYRRVMGFRPQTSTLKIISLGGPVKQSPAPEKKVAKTKKQS